VEASVRTIGLAAAIGVAALAVPAFAQDDAARQQERYQISQMERMLEGAVEHGAAIIRDRLGAVLPTDMLVTENARARGFRLEGYGVFFDVAVPSLQGTMPWIFHTLDQNDLGLASALKALRAHIEAEGDQNLQQALQRIELEVAPITAAAASGPDVPPASGAPPVAAAGARNRTGSAATVSGTAVLPATNPPPARPAAAAPAAKPVAAAAPPAPADDILNDPREAFHDEVRRQVVDALLDYASALGLEPTEWVTVALRPDDEMLVGPSSGQDFTMVLRVRGADLAAYRSGGMSKDDARKHVEVQAF
jgi:hypothetical protein